MAEKKGCSANSTSMISGILEIVRFHAHKKFVMPVKTGIHLGSRRADKNPGFRHRIEFGAGSAPE
jgi:hypothetical protein